MGKTEEKLKLQLKSLRDDFQVFSQKIPIARRDFDNLVDGLSGLTQGITSISNEDAPELIDLVEDIQERLTIILANNISELYNKAARIKEKSEIATGKTRESALSLVSMESQLSAMEKNSDRIKDRLADQQTLLVNIKQFLISDEDARNELLNLIGKDVIEDWIKRQ